MRIKLTKKFVAVIVALVLVIGLVPAVSAYEAHVVDVKAHVKDYPRATRTPGFWEEHYYYTEHVFEELLGNNIDIGWRDIYSMSQLMGIFFADVAKESDGSNRCAGEKGPCLCKAKVKAARHALAAILNSRLPNGANLPVSITEIQNTLNGTNIGDINALATLLDNHNNNPDYHDMPIFDSFPQGSANPDVGKAVADIPFADCP